MGKILIGTDGSESARCALRYAIDLAKKTGASIKAIRVINEEHYSHWSNVRDTMLHELAQEAIKILDEAKAMCEKENVAVELMPLVGSPPEQIIMSAQRDPEITLVVLGSRGKRRLATKALGTTSTRVAEQVGKSLRCPLLLVPCPSSSEGQA